MKYNCAEKINIRILEVLLDHGACINSLTLSDGYTPLQLATEIGHKEVVELLLNRGADINAGTKQPPLHLAIKKKHETIVKLLLQHGARVDDQDKYGRTTLQVAVEWGYLTIVKDVLKYCPDINNQSNRSCLKAVQGSSGQYTEIVEALMEYGINLTPEDAKKSQLLYAGIEKGCLKLIVELLKHGADVNTRSLKAGFTTPLHSAVKYQQLEIAKLLISYKADINVQDICSKTPIFYAIESANFKMTKLLLTHQANISYMPNLLHIAVQNDFKDIVEALLQHGADVNASDKDGNTALLFTCKTKKTGNNKIKGEIAKLLLSKGANVDAQTKTGETTLHAAIQGEFTEVVETVLMYNGNVNSVQRCGATALHLSAYNRKNKICQLLLKKGAHVNAKEDNGYTALHIASFIGNTKVVNILLEYGAEVNCKSLRDITPLHLAAKKGDLEIINILLKRGANINSKDADGKTALHMASEQGNENIVVTLLSYGTDINITCKKNHTPLDYVLARVRSVQDIFNYEFDIKEYSKNVRPYAITGDALVNYMVQMKTANIFLSQQNLLLVSSRGWHAMGEAYFQSSCEKEIASMKCEKITNPYISLYDILVKDARQLAMYMRNERIVQALKSMDFKEKFPIYASMIESQFRKGMQRKGLLEKGINIFQFLYPEVPSDCTKKIFSYLSAEDLKMLSNAGKSLLR